MKKTKNKQKLNPAQQLAAENLTDEEIRFLAEMIAPLKKEYHDAVCLSILAYIRFKMPCILINRFCIIIVCSFCELYNKHRDIKSPDYIVNPDLSNHYNW